MGGKEFCKAGTSVMLQFDFLPAPASVTLKGGEELSRGFVGQITHSVVSKRNAHIHADHLFSANA